MAMWTVWEKSRHGDDAALRATFVKDSFSWLAFLLPPLWLLANRMIVVLVVLCVLLAGAAWLAIDAGLSPDIVAAVVPVLMLWFGFEARALQRWALARRGWSMTGVVEARRFRNAERRYFTDRLAPSGFSVAAAGPSVPPVSPTAPARINGLPPIPPRGSPRKPRFWR